jgi:hypothetical protein
MDREEALARRIAAQQLDRAPAPRPLTDAAVLDLGVQDTGRDAASWALANRGVPVESPAVLHASSELALVWSLRGAPHYYRRAELRGVLDATTPYSDADARKRTLDASRPLTAAGIGMLEGLGVVAATMREVVRLRRRRASCRPRSPPGCLRPTCGGATPARRPTRTSSRSGSRRWPPASSSSPARRRRCCTGSRAGDDRRA